MYSYQETFVDKLPRGENFIRTDGARHIIWSGEIQLSNRYIVISWLICYELFSPVYLCVCRTRVKRVRAPLFLISNPVSTTSTLQPHGCAIYGSALSRKKNRSSVSKRHRSARQRLLNKDCSTKRICNCT